MTELTAYNNTFRSNNDNIFDAYEIKVGDKLCASNPYDESLCRELEKELNKYGFKTRVAQNIESKVWSVAIIE